MQSNRLTWTQQGPNRWVRSDGKVSIEAGSAGRYMVSIDGAILRDPNGRRRTWATRASAMSAVQDITNIRAKARGMRDCYACGGDGWLPSKATPATCHYCHGTGKQQA